MTHSVEPLSAASSNDCRPTPAPLDPPVPGTPDAPLWPARNVAEYAYCPRLFYYMEVEGIHLPSHDTEQGHRVHRRVDAPSNDTVSDEAATADRPKAVRSLTLTSPHLGLTATLDLAEIHGTTAIPIEYRKGRPRRVYVDAEDAASDDADAASDGVEPWPTDRIQVALQAILLEEAGYTVPEVVLYYAAEKRRVTLPFDEALRREALETLEAAKFCATGPRPLPLVNDPRCPRCSLYPICLPDELNHGRGEAPAGIKRRKLWPPRDDGIHLVAQQEGTKIGVRGGSMRVTDYEGRKVREMPLAGVESLSILGHVQISTQALATLADRGIPVAFLTAAGRLTALVDPLDSVSADTRRAQVRRFDDPAAALELSRALVAAKIANQRKLLMRNATGVRRGSPDPGVRRGSPEGVRRGSPDPADESDRRSQDPFMEVPTADGDRRSQDPFTDAPDVGDLDDEPGDLRSGDVARSGDRPQHGSGDRPQQPFQRPQQPGALARVLDALQAEAEKARAAASIDALRGHEGQAAALYFEHFANMLKTDVAREFDANGRQRRPAPDPVNACLSFAYSMLTHECTAALRTARLEPSIGAFHVSRPGRPALALDLMEPFRPLIADSIAISAFNRGELKAGHFLRTAAGCAFTDAGRKAFFGAWGRRMSEEVTHPVFGYKLSYRRMLILHARMIAAWLLGEVPTLEFLTTR